MHPIIKDGGVLDYPTNGDIVRFNKCICEVQVLGRSGEYHYVDGKLENCARSFSGVGFMRIIEHADGTPASEAPGERVEFRAAWDDKLRILEYGPGGRWRKAHTKNGVLTTY